MKEDYEFEWDDSKSQVNYQKHGFSFDDVTAIWDDPMFVEVHLMSFPEGRWAVIGKMGKNRYVTAIITYRGDKVRIISARKATKRETDIYGNN